MIVALLIPFVLGIAATVLATRLSRTWPPPLQALVVAAGIAFLVFPVLVPVPSLHGALPLPFYWIALTGGSDLHPGQLRNLALVPGILFVVVFLFAWPIVSEVNRYRRVRRAVERAKLHAAELRLAKGHSPSSVRSAADESA